MALFNIHDQWLGDVMPQSGVPVTVGRNTADGSNPAVPCIEMHDQLLMLHDSSASGIFSYSQPDLRVELIPVGAAPSGTQSIVPAVYFYVRDNIGGQDTFNTNITVDMKEAEAISHSEIFARPASDMVQINMKGVYEFEFSCGVATTTTTRVAHIVSMARKAPGGSFTLIDGTETHLFVRNQITSQPAKRRFILDDVAAGDQFLVQVRQNVVISQINYTTRADASSLIIHKLA